MRIPKRAEHGERAGSRNGRTGPGRGRGQPQLEHAPDVPLAEEREHRHDHRVDERHRDAGLDEHLHLVAAPDGHDPGHAAEEHVRRDLERRTVDAPATIAMRAMTNVAIVASRRIESIPTAAVGRKYVRIERPAVSLSATVAPSTRRPTRTRTLLRCQSPGRKRHSREEQPDDE